MGITKQNQLTFNTMKNTFAVAAIVAYASAQSTSTQRQPVIESWRRHSHSVLEWENTQNNTSWNIDDQSVAEFERADTKIDDYIDYPEFSQKAHELLGHLDKE